MGERLNFNVQSSRNKCGSLFQRLGINYFLKAACNFIPFATSGCIESGRVSRDPLMKHHHNNQRLITAAGGLLGQALKEKNVIAFRILSGKL
jgi:hypothetical protein